MRVTLLGHATVLVELDGANILMDPVLQDPFEDGAVTSCPKRMIRADKLPPLYAIIISHVHPDHFDIPSLAQLPRDVHVVCPHDNVIQYALKNLGFTNVHPTPPMSRMTFETYELLTTRSSVTNVVEFGIIFKDKSGTFWNQVDSVLSHETIRHSLQAVGSIDLLFAMHASQNFGFFENRSAGFPHDMHQENLATVLSIKPKLTVPGAAGFRFAGEIEWCNAFLFPISREQFVADLRTLDPSLATAIANPGDVFEIEAGAVQHRAGASEVAQTLEEDTWRLRFDPTAAIPPLKDTNSDGYSDDQLRSEVAKVISGLEAFLRTAFRSQEKMVAPFRELVASYAIEVVFPNGSQRYRIQFAKDDFRIESGPAAAAAAQMEHRITASALTGWARRERSYFYFRAFSRMFSTLHELKVVDGMVTVTPRVVPDLLSEFMTYKIEGAESAMKHLLDHMIRSHVRPPLSA
jgi:UDP-MurNAc hydroxylase